MRVPSILNEEELLPWEDALPLFADVLKGADVAENHKAQLLNWIPNVSAFCGSSNLNKLLDQITCIQDLHRFLLVLQMVSDTRSFNRICVRNYIKAQIKKKIVDIPSDTVSLHELNDVIGVLGLVFSREESSEIVLDWFLTTT